MPRQYECDGVSPQLAEAAAWRELSVQRRGPSHHILAMDCGSSQHVYAECRAASASYDSTFRYEVAVPSGTVSEPSQQGGKSVTRD
jgi:hypothetical protein